MVRVSVKGVVIVDGRVLLLKNEREEWELPGGKLEPGEEPEDCCRREILEETSLDTHPVALIDAWLYRPAPEGNVLILTYGCAPVSRADITISQEHSAAGLFAREELAGIELPAGYRRSIDRWFQDRGPDLER